MTACKEHLMCVCVWYMCLWCVVGCTNSKSRMKLCSGAFEKSSGVCVYVLVCSIT